MQINRHTTNPCGEIPLLPAGKRAYSNLSTINSVNSGIFATKEELDSVRNRIIIDNREGKIESIINGTDFTEKKLEEDEEYKRLIKKGVFTMGPPTMDVFHVDYISLLKPEK